MNTLLDPKPHNKPLKDTNFTYLDNAVIQAGQPIPWGLNWLITYPNTLNFQKVRI